jgi:hypothetical protein
MIAQPWLCNLTFFQLKRFALSHLFKSFSDCGGGIKIFYKLFIISLENFTTTLRFAFIRPQFSLSFPLTMDEKKPPNHIIVNIIKATMMLFIKSGYCSAVI